MAGIDVGGRHGAQRATNHEVPLIPFIDFLLCLVAFLLVTAVWSQMARVDATARVPGSEATPAPTQREKQLHVDMTNDRTFRLSWKEGTTVVNTIDVPRIRVSVGGSDDFEYPALAAKIADEWRFNGSHRAPGDPRFDQAVLHTNNSTQFQDVIAVIDALNTPERDLVVSGRQLTLPAFNVTFAVN